MKPRRLVWLVLAAAFALGSPAAALTWQVSINGSASGEDRATVVTADQTGDVIAAGLAVNRASGADFLVVKRAGADGREVWRAVLNGSANGDDRANAVAVDGAGHVLAAGVIRNPNGGFGDFAVVKLAGPTGAQVWRTLIGGSAHDFGEALAITVDRAGDVVAAVSGRSGDSGGMPVGESARNEGVRSRAV